MFGHLLLATFFVAALVTLVCGSGHLEIRLVSFHNDNGFKADGTCCDSNLTVCVTGCDYVFTICLDQDLLSNNATFCSYGKKVYRPLMNAKSVHFDQYVRRGDHNHFEVAFPHGWPGQLRMIFDVTDLDTRRTSDHVVTLADTIVARSGNMEMKSITKGDFSVEFRVIVQCNGHYYGPGCETYCLETDDTTGHYTCNPDNGDKLCLNGWGGPFCSSTCPSGYTGPGCSLFSACTPSPCQNGGICYPDGLNFECDCASTGYSGTLCETASTTQAGSN